MRGLARLGVLIAALAALAVAPPSSYAANRWVHIGGNGPSPVNFHANGNPNADAFGPSLAEVSGAPNVAWAEQGPGPYTIRTARHQGAPFGSQPWEHLPGSPDTNPSVGGSGKPDLVANGTALFATWTEASNAQQIRAAMWNGTAWSELGSGASPINSISTSNAQHPRIAVDTAGSPNVVWYEQEPVPTVHVRRWNGSAWVDVGPGSGVGTGWDPDIAMVGGIPYVVYGDFDTGGSGMEVTVKRYASNTNSWVQVGTGADAISTYSNPLQNGELRLDPTIADVAGAPVVAFTQQTGTQDNWQVRVKRFNGTSWVEPGGPSLNYDTSDNAFEARIATVGGVPHVAWVEDDGTNKEVRVSKLNGSTWTALGDGTSPINRSPIKNAGHPDIRAVGSTPVVAWEEMFDEGGSPHNEIRVAAYGDAPENTSRPQLTGTPQTGSQLSCGNGGWDGNPTQFTKTWERAPRSAFSETDPAWAPINNASGAQYTVQAGDEGFRVRCRVVASNAALAGEAVSVSKRTDAGIPTPSGPAQITGSHEQGKVVTCDPGPWTGNPDFSYRWYDNGNLVLGQFGATAEFKSASPLDNDYTCEVTGTNDIGSTPGARSPAFHIVGDVPRPQGQTQLVTDSFAGNPAGVAARCVPNKWLYAPDHFEYAWKRNGELIAGATGEVYRTTVDDLGKTLKCEVTGFNVKGQGSTQPSNEVLVPLPPGTGNGQIIRAGGRNEFDPVNFMALSGEWYAALSELTAARFTQAVDQEKARCQGVSGVPGGIPVPDESDFPNLKPEVRCALLLHNPSAVVIRANGVHYAGSYYTGKKRVKVTCTLQLGLCPTSLGFTITPVDPNNPNVTADPDELARLAPVIPERVLWDVNNDQRTDVECPGTAPVLRSIIEKGHWNPRAVIVTRDSATTGIYGSASDDFRHPDDKQSANPKVRSNQAFVCRTSVDPPKDPEKGPCITAGSIGRVQVTGNFCPIYLRALDPDSIAKLPPDVYDVLKAMNDKIGAARRRDTRVEVSAAGGSPLRAAQLLSPSERFATSALVNGQSSLGSFNPTAAQAPADAAPEVKSFLLARLPEALKKKVDKEKANFALDEIYWGKAASAINGVKLLPTKAELPTLLIPSDVENAIDASGFKSMTINSPSVNMFLGGVNPAEQLQIAASDELNARLEEAKGAGVAYLKDKLDLDSLAEKAKTLLGPFKLLGKGSDVNVKLNPDGTATLDAWAELPLLTNKDLTHPRVRIVLKGDVKGNLSLEGIDVGPVDAKLGPLELEGASLHYGDGIQVRAKILLPPGRQGLDIKNFQLDKKGEFVALDVDYLSGAGQGIPIGPGIYLTKIGGRLDREPTFHIGASATVSVGPSPTGGGCPTAGIDADADAYFGGNPDLLFTLQGKSNLVCIPLGDIRFRAGSDGLVTLDGGMNLEAGPVTVSGDIHAKIQADRNAPLGIKAWQTWGKAHAGIKDFFIFGKVGVDGELALSNLGIAACGSVDTFLGKIGAGAAVNFSNGRPPLHITEVIGNFRLFKGCDVSRYLPLGRTATLRSAQGGGSTTFKVPAIKGGVLISLEGAGDAPRVKLRSPKGEELDFTDASEGKQLPNAYGEILEQEDRTIVLLKDPAPGTWTAEVAEGSVPVNRVEFARIVPKPKVTARVTGKGAARTLTYSVAKVDGQVVRFVEDADGGHKVLATVKGGGTGKISYTLGETSSSSRSIVAEVEQDSLPRENITVARYKAANPRVGKPGGVRVRRSGSRAIVTWKRAALAATYSVVVSTPTGRKETLFPSGKKLTVTVPGVSRKDAMTVKVYATSPAGRTGPAGTARLAAPKKRKRK